MSSSDRTPLVQIVADEPECDPAAEHARRITELASCMDETNPFKKGQLVRWKAGLKNRILPAYNEPIIVREVLAQPLYDSCETARCTGSPFFGEPLTLVVGLIDPDGDFVELRYDGRRFEPLEAKLD
jgi:hypothetical protein